MGEWLNTFFSTPNAIWALVAIAGIALAAFKAWMRHQERLEQIRQGQEPDEKPVN